jgi:Zn finger protein HypA/HybF involved in hydrogenase expression
MRGTWAPHTQLSLAAARTCSGCHTGPHGTQFAARTDKGRCDACHSADAWRPANRFDHERDAAFSLKGAHAKVACARCHAAARPAAGRKWRPVSAKCESCHSSEVR